MTAMYSEFHRRALQQMNEEQLDEAASTLRQAAREHFANVEYQILVNRNSAATAEPRPMKRRVSAQNEDISSTPVDHFKLTLHLIYKLAKMYRDAGVEKKDRLSLAKSKKLIQAAKFLKEKETEKSKVLSSFQPNDSVNDSVNIIESETMVSV